MNIHKLGGRYYTDAELNAAGFKSVGKNVKIHNRSSIYCPENIVIGDNVRIQDFVVIVATGPVEVGNCVEINCFSYIGGTCGVRLGNYVTLAPGVKIFSTNDDYSGEFLVKRPNLREEFVGKDKGRVVLKDHVIVGVDSVVLPKITSGLGASVGAMSLVKNDLKSWTIYCGCPAKRIGERKRSMLRYL